jgi:hypothetical protein
MYAHNHLLSSILNIAVYVCMYVTMKDGRAAGAKLLEGFKVVSARHLVSHIL